MMMNAMMTIAGSAKHAVGSFPRFNCEDVESMWAEQIVDNAGYGSKVDLILARHERVERFFPTAEELSALGVDIVKLAACIEADLIVLSEFGGTIACLGQEDGISVEDLNGGFEHLLEMSADEAYRAHPHDAIDRAAHRAGCCACCCAA